MCEHVTETDRIPIVLPDLGAEDEPIRFAQWLVSNGGQVLEHDRVAEVLVGGMLFHVTSPAEGTVQHLVEQEGHRLDMGNRLGFVVPARIA